MTTGKIMDWHARRCGWAFQYNSWWHPTIMALFHPFPETLDGAASAMPPGWLWSRLFGFKMWYAARPGIDGRLPDGWEVETPDTGDEIHDRYLLAKLAWEAMA